MSIAQRLSLNSPQEHNRALWDQLAAQGHRFARPASAEELADPLGTVDGAGWLSGDIRGQKVLCLASGGGRQGPLYAAAGGVVTVVDISARQLEIDRRVAAEHDLQLRTVEASMDALTMFGQGEFDLVIHPVSTCYVPRIEKVYSEVARVTRHNGLYISQHKTPTNLQVDLQPSSDGYVVRQPYYRADDQSLPQVEDANSRLREKGTLEFVHRWEQLVGMMCRSGFVIEDLVEPLHADSNARIGSLGHRSRYVAPYVRIKARRHGSQVSSARILVAE
jgi:SAM-dependent methyltransferase